MASWSMLMQWLCKLKGNKDLAYLLQRRDWGLLLLAWQTHECPGFAQVDLA